MWVVATVLTLTSMPAQAQTVDHWFSNDKALHFGLSAGLSAGGYAGAAALGLKPRWARALTGGGFALALGGAKELYDLGGGGSASWKDFTWDVLGAVTGVGIAYCVDRFVFGEEESSPAPKVSVVFPSGPFDFRSASLDGWHRGQK
jgi:putative lipoprotein